MLFLLTTIFVTCKRLFLIIKSRAYRYRLYFTLVGMRRIVHILKGGGSDIDDIYATWYANMQLNETEREYAVQAVRFLKTTPIFHLIIVSTDPDFEALKSTIHSLQSSLYNHWRLHIFPGNTLPNSPKSCSIDYPSQPDDRIYWQDTPLDSEALHAMVDDTTDAYFGFISCGDQIEVNAFLEVAKNIETHGPAGLLYSDEDQINEHGHHFRPVFKPDFDPDLLLNTNYFSKLCVYRADLAKKLIIDFAFPIEVLEYDLALQISESGERIGHIPHMLFSRPARTEAAPENADSIKACKHVLQTNLSRTGTIADVEQGKIAGSFRVRYELHDNPMVSIIVPSGGNIDNLERCYHSVANKTSYANYEFVVVDNSKGDEVAQYCRTNQISGIQIKRIECRETPFNFSVINNYAVSQVESPYLLFLNDDTEVISEEWMSSMLEHAQRPEVGIVGAKLLFANGLIQHAGVIFGRGYVDHAYRLWSQENARKNGHYDLVRNYSAITFACAMIRRDVFEEVRRLDEVKYPVAFNDLDFCLRIKQAGYRVIYTPYAELYHLESVSRKGNRGPRPGDVLLEQWGKVLYHDPYYNRNLSTMDVGGFVMPLA
ncbi:glycosyltransferase family 2 protein [Calycomorphotria hydatis]|uniref:Glycosyl transferase family 2 n=1 Tax=Calycomorphotria hydatis TaxID=2528027 RepID=A0A517TED5_9PLAN|nr:glycosyltransferase [Calycomorphotria hydatis]QDT66740.1 Glycosyl transferase family 2 [Calycomorphotria hydatis]